jgi:hypothetical protein
MTRGLGVCGYRHTKEHETNKDDDEEEGHHKLGPMTYSKEVFFKICLYEFDNVYPQPNPETGSASGLGRI